MKEEEEEEEMPQSIYRDAFATIHLQTWLFSFTTASLLHSTDLLSPDR